MAGSSTLAELDDPPSPDGRQGGNNRIQGDYPSGIPLSEPPSGGYAKLATAAATALPLPPPLPRQGSRGLQDSDPERQGPASPAAAAGRPPPYTAINVGSSVNHRFELSIKLSTSKLQKLIGEMKLIKGGKEKGDLAKVHAYTAARPSSGKVLIVTKIALTFRPHQKICWEHKPHYKNISMKSL